MSTLRCLCGHSALDCACVLRDPPGEPSPEETATLARIYERLPHGAVAQADEWVLTADDPRRCQRCQSAPCGCHGTDAAQARASLPDRVVLDVWVKR